MTSETVGDAYRGSVARTIHRAKLIAECGPRIQEYYCADLAMEDLDHWVEVVGNDSASDDEHYRLNVE